MLRRSFSAGVLVIALGLCGASGSAVAQQPGDAGARSAPASSANNDSENEPPPAPLSTAAGLPEATAAVNSPPAASEMDLFRLETEVAKVAISIASKREELPDEAPGSITVITREQIRDMNAQSLSDVLNALVPGMDAPPTYFRYGDHNTAVYSRGLLSDFSQQVLFLLNGQTKFNESTYGSPYMAIMFTLENIERIEVSRTPVPLQGGGAITVINLVTKEQYLRNSAQGFLDLSANQDDFTSTVLQAMRVAGILNHDLGPLRVSASVQYLTDRGQAHPDPNGQGGYPFDPSTLRDGVRTFTNFTFALSTKDDRFFFHSWFQYVLEDPFLAGQTPTPSTEPYKYDGTQWLTQLRLRPWRQLHLNAGSMLGISTSITDYQSVPYLSSGSNYDVYAEAYYDFRFTAGGQHSLLLGARYEREGQYANETDNWMNDHFVRAPDQPNYSRTILSYFLDESFRAFANRLFVTGGARLDLYDGFVEAQLVQAPSGRVSLQVRPRSEISINLTYATVVRPPSIYEVFGSGDPSIVGSPNVNPERVQTLEASLAVRFRGLRAQLTPYFQFFSDKIEYVPDAADTVFTARNNGNTRVLGLDLDLRYNFTPRTYVFANGSYVNSYDLTNNYQTYFLPSTYINFGGNYYIRRLNLNAYAYYRDKRPLPSELVVNTKNTTYNFTLNASASYSFKLGLRLYVLIENLSGIRNNIPLSTDGLYFPTNGRTFHLGVQYGKGID